MKKCSLLVLYLILVIPIVANPVAIFKAINLTLTIINLFSSQYDGVKSRGGIEEIKDKLDSQMLAEINAAKASLMLAKGYEGGSKEQFYFLSQAFNNINKARGYFKREWEKHKTKKYIYLPLPLQSNSVSIEQLDVKSHRRKEIKAALADFSTYYPYILTTIMLKQCMLALRKTPPAYNEDVRTLLNILISGECLAVADIYEINLIAKYAYGEKVKHVLSHGKLIPAHRNVDFLVNLCKLGSHKRKKAGFYKPKWFKIKKGYHKQIHWLYRESNKILKVLSPYYKPEHNDQGIYRLDLSQRQIADVDLIYLSKFPKLYFLDLSQTNVNNENLSYLNNLRNLSSLSLQWTNITHHGLTHITKLTNLNTLDLSKTRVSDKGFDRIKHLNKLKFLNLSGTNIKDKSAKYIGTLTKLTSLNLSKTSMGDKGLKHLRSLVNLSTLSLFDTKISDVGLKTVGLLPNITRLNLAGTEISDVGLMYLQTSTKISYINLNYTQVADDGLRYLQKLSNLSYLFLDETKITNRHLHALKGFKKLKVISLNNTRVTKGGVLYLMKTLPGCTIIH